VYKGIHKTVLLQQTIDNLEIANGDIIVDATIGLAGHSREIAKRFGKKVKIIGFDLDRKAIKKAESVLEKEGADFVLIQNSFKNLDKALQQIDISKVDGIIFDLGWSTDQMKHSGRGLSFSQEEPLLMTLGDNQDEGQLTASTIVNSWDEENIELILRIYGNERFSKRIARNIVLARKEGQIETTLDLVEIIGNSVPSWYRHSRIHFATKTFQALRIAVNDEITALKNGLEKGFQILSGQGRMAVISFHQLEDRIVKLSFREKVKEELAKLVNKKPIVPNKEELLENPSSRSAKLRIIEKYES
jgi:16S rRNA (cytosine1402-N4)-methyltransferase